MDVGEINIAHIGKGFRRTPEFADRIFTHSGCQMLEQVREILTESGDEIFNVLTVSGSVDRAGRFDDVEIIFFDEG